MTDPAGGGPRSIPLEGPPERQLYLSPDGGHVSVSVFGRETRVWDVRTGDVLFRQKRPEKDTVMAVLPAPDGRSLVRSVVGAWVGSEERNTRP